MRLRDAQAAGQSGHAFARQRLPRATAHAEAPAVVLGFVVDVAPGQAAGVEPVFVRVGGAGDDRALEIGAAADVDLEAAVAGGQARRLGDGFVVVVHAGGAGVATEAHAAFGPAVDQREARVPLFAGEVAGVLLADQGEVVADVGEEGLPAGLRALEQGIVTGDEAQRAVGIDGGDGMRGAVAVGAALAAVEAEEDAGSFADADADLAAGMGAGLFLGVMLDLAEQVQVVAGGQGHVVALDLAADDVEVAVGGGDGDVALAADVAAVSDVVVGVGVAVGGTCAQ